MPDPAQDQDFLAAPMSEQHAYLIATDKDYAAAKPEEQKAYIRSLNPLTSGKGMEHPADKTNAIKSEKNPYINTLTGAKQSFNPRDARAPSELSGMNTTPQEDAENAGITSMILGLGTNPASTARALIGSTGGALVGGETARGITHLIAPKNETAADWSGKIGAGVGGLAGGIGLGGASAEDIPPRLKNWMPRWMIPGPSQEELGRGAFMNRGYRSMIGAGEQGPSIVRPGEEPISSNPQDLISRTRRPILSGEQPGAEDLKRAGDLTQAPLQKLQLLKRFGDKLAENEINRRLKN